MFSLPKISIILFILSLLFPWGFFLQSIFAAEKIKVITTIRPYKEFVESVGGEKVEVTVLIPPGANPHTYELTPGQLREISQADLYIKVGSGIEFELVWIDKIISLNREMTVCDSSEGLILTNRESGRGESVPHPEHGSPLTHHPGWDPHVWLSPRNAQVIVENIARCLLRVDPGHGETYLSNANDYLQGLEELDQEIKEKLSRLETRAFIVFHPAWSYFARDYDLEQIPIEIEGKEPSPQHIIEVVEAARKHYIKTIFVSPQINPKTARVIADEIKGEVVAADPLAEDYIKNLKEMAANISGKYE